MDTLDDWMTLDRIIDYLERTSEDSWLTEYCRSQNGAQHCLLSHVFNYGEQQQMGSLACDLFEEMHATTYMFFPVNDGEDLDYPQPTPKQRILAYLRDLRDGKKPTTYELMEREGAAYMERERPNRER